MASNNPCDEMVSDLQVIDYVRDKGRREWFRPDAHDPYLSAASIWGISRDEAKRRVYAVAYGVVSPRRPVRERVDAV